MGKIKILNETIEFKEREMKVDELLFWSENPRVHSELHAVDGMEPTQKEIEDILTSKDHVKQLRNSIKTNGGLTHPVFVRDGVVVEGNSRLAAYRLLCRNDKITWAKIRCNVLPPDMSDDLVFSFIASIHVNGVTEWSPFEQAGYLVRHQMKSKKPIEAIAKDCGLTPSTAKLLVKVYETMQGNDDTDPNKFSYYLEMLKHNAIVQKSASNPSLNLIDTLCQKIKNGEIYNAADLRKVAKLAKAVSQDANEALDSYLKGNESLDSAVAKVSEEEKKKHALDVAKKFREMLVDKDYVIRLMNDEEEFNFEMGKIISRLKKISEKE